MRATALQLRRALWREAADRILLEEIEKLKDEKASANVENAGQIGPGKSDAPVTGRGGAGPKGSVGD